MSSAVRILNVNDDAATRYLLTRMLRKTGYDVIEAMDGTTALRLAQAQRPDLVVLDIRLPDISGLEVCRLLKSSPETSAISVIQTSATFVSVDRKIEGLDSGADAYLAQPVEEIELLAMIRAVLRTKRAEEAERQAAQRWQRTFDAINDVILIFDTEGRVLRRNRAAERLLPQLATGDRVTGEALFEVLPVTREIAALLEKPISARVETEVEAAGRWYRIALDPLPDPNGTDGVIATLIDVTERKRLEESHRRKAAELSEVAQRKDEFLAMLAHELRNPLNAISASNLVQDRVGPKDPESLRLRSTVARQVRNLARLVDDLLDISRINKGQIQLRRANYNLTEILRSAAESSRQAFEARRQHFDLTVPKDPVWISGDDLRLEQAVCNLLSNASKYSEPHTRVSMSLETQQRDGRAFAVVRVRDAGIGIPAEMLDSVFDMFVQVDHSLARTLGGLGIGLAVVRSIVELHDGQVSAHSDGSGKGAEFTLSIPALGVTMQAAHTAAVERAAKEEDGGRTPLNVLVVEDSDDARELVTMWLEMAGHKVESAGDGHSGLELALANRPDAALVDIGIPGMDGYELAKSLRAAETDYHVHLIAVTGYGRPEDKARALDAGFDAYLVKPVDGKMLQKALEAGVANARSKARVGSLTARS